MVYWVKVMFYHLSNIMCPLFLFILKNEHSLSSGSKTSRRPCGKARKGLGCNSHSDKERKVSRLEEVQGTGWNNQATMTNESREAGRREGNRGTVEEENCFEEKGREKQELVILLARAGLQSFNGLHKVDDRDVLCWTGCVTQSQDTFMPLWVLEVNAASSLSCLQPVALGHNTSTGLLSTRCTFHVLQNVLL